MTLRLEVSATSAERLVEATRDLEAYSRQHGLSARRSRALRLVVEELLANVVEHGRGDGATEPVVVLANESHDALELVIIDEAGPFDPTIVPGPPQVCDGPSGGTGLTLVRRLADRLDYVRRDGRNRTIAVFVKEETAEQGGGMDG